MPSWLPIVQGWIYGPYQEQVFCTREDEIYQSIKDNLDAWLNYFPADPPILDFRISNGLQYSVLSELWDSRDDPPVFFVVTEYDYPHSFLGERGYLYLPEPKAFEDFDEYKLRDLGDDIYCYDIKK